MKKIISILIATIIMLFNVGCMSKTYSVGDTQTMKGVQLKVVDVKTTCDYGMVGWYVTVYFEMENTNSEPYYLNYLHFTLNDCYTICEVVGRNTNIESGGFKLVKGEKYEFYTKFTTRYRHDEKDMIFIWESNGLFSDTREWVL